MARGALKAVDVSICSIDDRMIVFARTKVKARCFLRRRAIYAPRGGRSAVDAGGVGALRRTNFFAEDGSGITRIGNPTGYERRFWPRLVLDSFLARRLKAGG
jgi:ribosomal protein S27E